MAIYVHIKVCTNKVVDYHNYILDHRSHVKLAFLYKSVGNLEKMKDYTAAERHIKWLKFQKKGK